MGRQKDSASSSKKQGGEKQEAEPVKSKNGNVGGEQNQKPKPKFGASFESGINTECIQLLRQLWNLHEEATEFLIQLQILLCIIRRLAKEANNNSNSQNQGVATGGGGGGGSNSSSSSILTCGKSPIPGNPSLEFPHGKIATLIQPLKSICDNVSDVERQFRALSLFQSHCKLVLYAKIRQAKEQVSHDRLSILHACSETIHSAVDLLWRENEEMENELLAVFQLTQVFNWCLELAWVEPLEATATPTFVNTQQAQQAQAQTQSQSQQPPSASSSSAQQKKVLELVNQVKIVTQLDAAMNNDSPLLRLSLKSLPASRILQNLATKRAIDLSKSFVEIFHRNANTLTNQINTSEKKEKKGKSLPQPSFDLGKFSCCILKEDERGLDCLARCFSQTPSLLGRAAVKKDTDTGENRLSRSARTKMFNFFHETLWTAIGEISIDILLWSHYNSFIPLVLKPMSRLIQLPQYSCQSPQTDGVWPLILNSVEYVMSALNSFVQLAGWDEKMQDGFSVAHKVKRPEHVELVRNPPVGEWSSEIGRRFGDIVATCLMLISRSCERGAGIPINVSFVPNTNVYVNAPASASASTATSTPAGTGTGAATTANPTVDPVQQVPTTSSSSSSAGYALEPFMCDEAAMIFRLDATLAYFNAWMVRRCKVWLNGWAIPQFVACSQRDTAIIFKSVNEKKNILTTRQLLLSTENISLRLMALHRESCAEDLFATLKITETIDDDLLMAVGPVSRTLSLATLQSYMPAAPHWRGGPFSGLDPDKPSSYVQVFIGRVIEPVISALVEFVPGPVQEAMGKQVVQAACEAWLQYILQKKIHFSEWGAVQLLRDFISLRDWIRTETNLESEARKAILQLEVLKRCEGCAYLLLRSDGDVLGVGKPTRKNRRVAPSDSVDSNPSTPSMNSVAEDDIPCEMYVPNQNDWLELRLRKSILSSCCE